MPGAGMFRSHSTTDLKEFAATSESMFEKWTYARRAWPNRNSISKLAAFLDPYDADSWAKRIEHNTIDLYSNDSAFYNAVSTEYQNSIVHRFEPAAGVDLNASMIIVSKLPHDKFNYRVYLLPHKMAGDREGKQRYIDWLKSQAPRVSISAAVERWFIATDFNWDRRYVLVEDEQTLLMMKLRNSDIMGRVYNFVISDK